MLARGVPVLGERGRVVEWVATNSDLTARETADAARREMQEWFRTLLETIPQMVADVTVALADYVADDGLLFSICAYVVTGTASGPPNRDRR